MGGRMADSAEKMEFITSQRLIEGRQDVCTLHEGAPGRFKHFSLSPQKLFFTFSTLFEFF